MRDGHLAVWFIVLKIGFVNLPVSKTFFLETHTICRVHLFTEVSFEPRTAGLDAQTPPLCRPHKTWFCKSFHLYHLVSKKPTKAHFNGQTLDSLPSWPTRLSTSMLAKDLQGTIKSGNWQICKFYGTDPRIGEKKEQYFLLWGKSAAATFFVPMQPFFSFFSKTWPTSGKPPR